MIHVLGASGRLGQMLRWAWGDRADVAWHMGRGAGDVLAPSPALRAALGKAEVVVNLSGVTPAPGADLALNVPLGTAPVALAPQARILTASSAAVYGLSDAPHMEDTPCAPLSDYGKAKAMMENAIAAMAPRNHMILRIGNVAGADQLLGGLGSNTPRLHCFGDEMTPLRSYIGPRGLADAIDALIKAPYAAQTVNIAAAPMTMGSLLDAAGRPFLAEPAPAGLPPRVILDTSRLRDACPKLSLADTPEAIMCEWTAFRDRETQGL